MEYILISSLNFDILFNFIIYNSFSSKVSAKIFLIFLIFRLPYVSTTPLMNAHTNPIRIDFKFEETNTVDVVAAVCQLRQDRGCTVQTADQFQFIHKVSLDELKKDA